MLKRHFALINFIRVSLDVLTTGILWNVVYYFRFYSGVFDHSGIPSYLRHFLLTVPVVIIVTLCRHWAGIYRSLRIEPAFRQFRRQVESILLGYMFIVLFLYYSEPTPYTRTLLVLFLFTLLAGLLASHSVMLLILHWIRSKGKNLRHYGIIGTGKNAIKLLQDIEACSSFGLRCSFLIDNKPQLEGRTIAGITVHGNIEKLPNLAKATGIDEIYLAVSGPEAVPIHPYLKELQNRGITVRILPDWGPLAQINRPSAIMIGSSVLFTASESPLTGMNIILKDIIDRLVSFALLCLFSVPMLIIAALVKLSGKGPVLYRQERIGMDNQPFEILKFRTMHSQRNDPLGWTVKNDPRRTIIGKFLRPMSLDELPQLINVLKGQMSLVGPRPEQPHFTKKFSDEYKKYMFRHKVKSGMTGWAQIHGFRGDSSLRKRTQYDLYYIRNWSVWLDLLILIRTPFVVLKQKNAY
ncbi:MAG: exopolysaccharide biosynthesis polyprenyl glycosylphosphotransferase [Planctomycetes bacterium]|nr:exopolysaccharide biosynthesis polyprenyl glycosylphosphotransferase [Planctomycetota bacterium]